MSDVSRPRVLLIEDDAVSSAFLIEALASLPVDVDHAATLATASHLTASTHHALWLVDANLPDGRGDQWLKQQRAAGLHCPALALTAEAPHEGIDSFIAAGFSDVLPKPLPIALLHRHVMRLLGHESTPASLTIDKAEITPLWDEQQGLSALGGDHTAISVLRALFLKELPTQRDAILAALSQGDYRTARDVLHMLKASTALIGAARLAHATQALSRTPDASLARQQFIEAVNAHLAD